MIKFKYSKLVRRTSCGRESGSCVKGRKEKNMKWKGYD